jgi:hypothetical protein
MNKNKEEWCLAMREVISPQLHSIVPGLVDVCYAADCVLDDVTDFISITGTDCLRQMFKEGYAAVDLTKLAKFIEQFCLGK